MHCTTRKKESPISHEKKKKKRTWKKFHNLNARKGLTKNLDVVLLPVDYDSGRAQKLGKLEGGGISI